MGEFEEALDKSLLQMVLEAPAFEKRMLNEPRILGVELKYSKTVKPKKEKHLISVSEEFYQELVGKLGKTKGITWEYLLKRLLEKVEEKE